MNRGKRGPGEIVASVGDNGRLQKALIFIRSASFLYSSHSVTPRDRRGTGECRA